MCCDWLDSHIYPEGSSHVRINLVAKRLNLSNVLLDDEK